MPTMTERDKCVSLSHTHLFPPQKGTTTMKQFVPVYTSIDSMLTGTPIGLTILNLPTLEEIELAELLDAVEADVVADTRRLGPVDPEAASGCLDRSYYTDGAWLNDAEGEVDIFADQRSWTC